jgi:hypothetical protein
VSKPECSDAEVCTDANVEVKRLRREVRRYRALIRYWRGRLVISPEEFDDALNGKAVKRGEP